MVSDNEKEKYKEVLGHRYTKKIIAYLKIKELYNSNGQSYSPGHITNVMTGRTSHDIIESSILEVYKIEKAKQEAKNKLLNKI